MGASVRVEEATVENWQQVLQEIKDDCDADLKKILENSTKDGQQTVENIGTINSFLDALLETKRNQ